LRSELRLFELKIVRRPGGSVTDEERARLTQRIGELALESERLYDQHERRLSEENQRESTMLAALRRMQGDPTVDVEVLRTLSDEMKQRFVATMTEFSARIERLKTLHAERPSNVSLSHLPDPTRANRSGDEGFP
jgi:hypothetical protein